MNGDEEWKGRRDRALDAMEQMLTPLMGTDEVLGPKVKLFIDRVRNISTEGEYERFNLFCRDKNLEFLKALITFETN